METRNNISNTSSDKSRIFDISIYRTNEGKIEIRLDYIYQGSENPNEKTLPLDLHNKILKHPRNLHYYISQIMPNLSELLYQTNLNDKMLISKNRQSDEIVDKNSETYQRLTIIYPLSTSLHVVLHWFACFADYLQNLNNDFVSFMLFGLCNSIHIKKSIDSNPLLVDESGALITINEYAERDNYYNDSNKLVVLLENLLSLKLDDSNPNAVSDPYADIFCGLKKITDAYSQGRSKGTPFIKYISNETRHTILLPEASTELFDDKISKKNKEIFLLNLSREYIAKNQQPELNFLLNHFQLLRKRNLFSLCLGKKAHDGGEYTWKYTEWDFLLHAEFSMKNNKVCIVNLEGNLGYQGHYAKGKATYNFEAEMNYLVNILNLGFEENCDFHVEPTFDEKSSKKLKELGFLLTTDHMKKIIYVQNTWKLFSNSQIDKRDRRTNIPSLLKDALESNIQDEMETLRVSRKN